MSGKFRDPRTAKYGEGRTRCITVDGIMFNVTSSFDDTEGSEDLATLKELATFIRKEKNNGS